MDITIERNQINIEDEMRRSYLDYAMASSSDALCPTCATG